MLSFFFSFYRGSFSYASRAGFIFIWGVSLTQPELAFIAFIGSADTSVSFLCGEFLLHIPCSLFLCAKFLLHIPCCLHFSAWSFSYTSHASFVFFSSWDFSYTSRAGFIFIWGVSQKQPLLDLHFCRVFLLHIPCWLLFLIWGVSLTH